MHIQHVKITPETTKEVLPDIVWLSILNGDASDIWPDSSNEVILPLTEELIEDLMAYNLREQLTDRIGLHSLIIPKLQQLIKIKPSIQVNIY